MNRSTQIRRDGLYLTVGDVLLAKPGFFDKYIGFVVPEQDLDTVYRDVQDDGMGAVGISGTRNIQLAYETDIMVVEEIK